MTKKLKGMPQDISEVLLLLAAEYDNPELERVAVYVDDLEEQISYHRGSSEMVFKYITGHSRLRVALMILAGETSLGGKITTLEMARKFARNALEYADAD
jgi:hypothetical protein